MFLDSIAEIFRKCPSGSMNRRAYKAVHLQSGWVMRLHACEVWQLIMAQQKWGQSGFMFCQLSEIKTDQMFPIMFRLSIHPWDARARNNLSHLKIIQSHSGTDCFLLRFTAFYLQVLILLIGQKFLESIRTWFTFTVLIAPGSVLNEFFILYYFIGHAMQLGGS